MGATPLAWSLSVGLIIALLLFDYFFHVRKEHIPTLKESAIWSALYVGIALVFGGLVALLFLFGLTESRVRNILRENR